MPLQSYIWRCTHLGVVHTCKTVEVSIRGCLIAERNRVVTLSIGGTVLNHDNEKMDFDDRETMEDLLLDLPPEEIDRLYDEMMKQHGGKDD